MVLVGWRYQSVWPLCKLFPPRQAFPTLASNCTAEREEPATFKRTRRQNSSEPMWATLAAWLQKYSSSSSLSHFPPPPPACPYQRNCFWSDFDLARLCSLTPRTCSPAPCPPPPPPCSRLTSPGQSTQGSFGSTLVLCTQNPTAPHHGNIFRRQVNSFLTLL